MTPRRLAVGLGLVVGLLGACSGKGSQTDDSGGPATTDTDTDTDSGGPVDPLCVDAPIVTWESWGQGFLGANCQSCHSTESTDRHGAPEGVAFDTHGSTLALADRILERSAGSDPTMPPSGGVSEDDRYLLEVWLTCWE